MKVKGYRQKDFRRIEEVNSDCYFLEHIKTGAEIVYLKNEDPNKTFSITFKTPPSDNTGIAHIMEHSVLCGSKRFPVKELFMDIVKSSLNTFLNAMTFPDKTMYPFSSTNDKDFRNLLEVYLDSVLYPNIYEDDLILQQEGWRYEPDSQTGEFTYNGVVYNEMKGAFSSPRRIIESKLKRVMYEDTPYGYESGGDPEYITDLTKEQFLDFHKKYYHPSNSKIFLYGNLDIESTLDFIAGEFLDNFEKLDFDLDIPLQEKFISPKDVTDYYNISLEEDEKDNVYFSRSYLFPQSTNTEIYYALSVLSRILVNSSFSPLKIALQESGIAKEVNGSEESSIKQMCFTITVSKSNISSKEKFINIIDSTLKNLVENGIDKKLIESAINTLEFYSRESDYKTTPKGLVFNIVMMDSWLYGADPFIHLEFNKTFEKIRKALTTDYFEKMIKEYLIDNKHQVVFSLIPKKGLDEENSKKIKEKLKAIKENCSEEELNSILDLNERLKIKQSTPDSPENIKKLPKIRRYEINPKANKLNFEKSKEADINFLESSIFTNKIDYITFSFDTKCVSQEDIPYLSLLSVLICNLDTENYSYSELNKEIYINTGGIYHSAFSYIGYKDAHNYKPVFEVSMKALHSKLDILLELFTETSLRTKFEDYERIFKHIKEKRSQAQNYMIANGHIVAINRARSYFNEAFAYQEILSNIEYIKFLAELEKNFYEMKDEIIAKLLNVAKLVFNKNNITVAITSMSENIREVKDKIIKVLEGFPKEENSTKKYIFELKNKKEGYITPGNVQYVATAADYKELGFNYSGAMKVLQNILSVDFLVKNIRIKGGAYGTNTHILSNGLIYFLSYRDPNLDKTLNVYKESYKFIEDLELSDEMLFNYVVGNIGSLDIPITPSMINGRILSRFMQDYGEKEVQKERDEILNVTLNDIKILAKMIKESVNKEFICVVGNEEKINSQKYLFKDVINLFI